MTFDDYQILARRTQNKALPLFKLREHALYGLASEVGEVLGLHQKQHQGHVLDDTVLRLEVGDVFWFISEICDVYGWSMDEIAEANIAKLKNRYPVEFKEELSINREEYKPKPKEEKPKKDPTVSKSHYYTSIKEVSGNA